MFKVRCWESCDDCIFLTELRLFRDSLRRDDREGEEVHRKYTGKLFKEVFRSLVGGYQLF